jgi:hypothetical protein
MHVHHIEGYEFSSEGYWWGYRTNRFDSPSTEIVQGLRWFFQLLSVETHLVEG